MRERMRESKMEVKIMFFTEREKKRDSRVASNVEGQVFSKGIQTPGMKQHFHSY